MVSKLFELNLGAMSQSLQTKIRRKVVTTLNIYNCMCGQGRILLSMRGGSHYSLNVSYLTLEAMTPLFLIVVVSGFIIN